LGCVPGLCTWVVYLGCVPEEGRSANWSMGEKMAASAPMPSASESTATAVKMRAFERLRKSQTQIEYKFHANPPYTCNTNRPAERSLLFLRDASASGRFTFGIGLTARWVSL
jgi:hypothetical protein